MKHNKKNSQNDYIEKFELTDSYLAKCYEAGLKDDEGKFLNSLFSMFDEKNNVFSLNWETFHKTVGQNKGFGLIDKFPITLKSLTRINDAIFHGEIKLCKMEILNQFFDTEIIPNVGELLLHPTEQFKSYRQTSVENAKNIIIQINSNDKISLESTTCILTKVRTIFKNTENIFHGIVINNDLPDDKVLISIIFPAIDFEEQFLPLNSTLTLKPKTWEYLKKVGKTLGMNRSDYCEFLIKDYQYQKNVLKKKTDECHKNYMELIDANKKISTLQEHIISLMDNTNVSSSPLKLDLTINQSQFIIEFQKFVQNHCSVIYRRETIQAFATVQRIFDYFEIKKNVDFSIVNAENLSILKYELEQLETIYDINAHSLKDNFPSSVLVDKNLPLVIRTLKKFITEVFISSIKPN